MSLLREHTFNVFLLVVGGLSVAYELHSGDEPSALAMIVFMCVIVQDIRLDELRKLVNIHGESLSLMNNTDNKLIESVTLLGGIAKNNRENIKELEEHAQNGAFK